MNTKRISALAGVAALGASMSVAHGAQHDVTRATVIVEEFTAEWCGPCYGGFYAMERMQERWGDAVSLLTWSIADRYTHSDATRRQSEVGVNAIPSFLFQGTYFSVGTPADSTIDTYVRNCQAQTPSAQIIGRWKMRNNGTASIGLKVQADVDLSNYELRILITEDAWYVPCSNGLTHYNDHVQAVYYEALPAMQAGDQEIIIRDYDLSGNQWIHNYDEIEIKVFLHNRGVNRSVNAGWEMGAVNLGDLNGDLSITMDDARLFLRQGGKRLGDPGFNPAADWDGNGVITQADRTLFVNYVQNGGMR